MCRYFIFNGFLVSDENNRRKSDISNTNNSSGDNEGYAGEFLRSLIITMS